MVVPALPVVVPPGLTVHVAAVANAGAAAMPIMAAAPALMINAVPKRLRIALAPFRRGLLHCVPIRLRSARGSSPYDTDPAAHSGHKVTRGVAADHTLG